MELVLQLECILFKTWDTVKTLAQQWTVTLSRYLNNSQKSINDHFYEAELVFYSSWATLVIIHHSFDLVTVCNLSNLCSFLIILRLSYRITFSHDQFCKCSWFDAASYLDTNLARLRGMESSEPRNWHSFVEKPQSGLVVHRDPVQFTRRTHSLTFRLIIMGSCL